MSARVRWKPGIVGALTGIVAACAVDGGGYYGGPVDVGYVGGYYDPCCWDYGGWGGAYYVGPPRGGYWHDGDWHGEQGRGYAGHGAGGWRGGGGRVGRGAPSIPSHPRGR